MTVIATTRCSFCAKEEPEVDKMIAGAGVYICNQCVDLCVEIIGAPQDPGAGAQLPYWESMTDQEILDHLPRIAAVSSQVEDNLQSWVRHLRDRGVSWARIGSALAMTRQSAWERFSGED